MKLLSENQYEDQLILNLTVLLSDLGVNVDGYLHEDAIAPMFWSANDIELEANAFSYMSKEDKIAFLRSLEDALCASMRNAGLRTISHAISHAQGGHAHLNARSLRK